MRPVVQCGDTGLTLTASGRGYSQLFVDREGAPPISVFHLPPNCGYLVRASWNGLVMVAPFDGCYVTQENGRYVLPMLWWDSPLKLSCPVQKTSPSPPILSAPSAQCSHYGVAVHMYGTEEDISKLGTLVMNEWAPLVSAKCAYRTVVWPGELIFYIPLTAPCLQAKDGFHLRVLKDDQEFSLSCPDHTSLLPIVPIPPLRPPPFPVDPHYPHPLDPVTPAPTTTSPSPPPLRSPTQGLLVQLPEHLNYPDPGFKSLQLPQVQPRGPQPKRPSQPSPVGSLEPQPRSSHLYFGPGQQQFSPPSPPQQPAVEPTSDPDVNQYTKWPQYLSQDDAYMPFYGSQVTPQAPVPSTQISTTPPSTYPTTPATTNTNTTNLGTMGAKKAASHCPYPHTFCGYDPSIDPSPLTSSQPTTLVTRESQPYTNPAPPTSTIVMSPTIRPPASLSRKLPKLQCLNDSMAVFLPYTQADSIQVRVVTADFKKAWLPLSSVSPLCKFMLLPTEEPGLIVQSPLPACHSQQKTPKSRSLRLRFWDVSLARNRILELQCPSNSTASTRVQPRDVYKQSPEIPPAPPETEGPRSIPEVPPPSPIPEINLPSPLAVTSYGCNIPEDRRLPCGTGTLTKPQCLSMGCCFDKQPPYCYYPMEACTLDRNFVFSVPAALTDPPLSPALLVAPGNTPCKPRRVTPDYALFQIPLDSCGARSVLIGNTLIYILEIINNVESISLNYGTITRDSPVRILVECRYSPGPPVVTTGYMTKVPTLGPGYSGQGAFGVQLRIAKDAQYSSYHSQYHVPMHMLLGEPLYLELRLVNPPDLQLVLLVHYCVAYPRSGDSMWVLLYKECPNPFDPGAYSIMLATTESQTRRFTIATFQFLQMGKTYIPDEEIYFMCSTEVCSSQDGPCVEGCLGQ